jgi:outer membrane lipase/esterase
MNARKRILPALILSAFAAVAVTPAAEAVQFSRVVVFGDSLSDAGYFRPFLASLGLPAPVVAQLGRFTTNPGPVWSELVSNFYGTTPAPSNAGGLIYAQGGARVAVDSTSTPPGSAQRSVLQQITEHLAANNGAADPNALYTVWIGANDIFQNLGAASVGAITPAQLQTNVVAAANAEIQQVGRLYAAGARYVAVFTLPDIGATPQFGGTATAATVTALSAGYNTSLMTGLASVGLRPIAVDTFALFTEVRANPLSFGFTNITTPACGPFPPITTAATISSQFCLSGPGGNLVAPNADRNFAFADGVHPSSGSHALIANFVESLIEGPVAYSLLAEAPLHTRANHVQTLNDGLAFGARGEIGRLTAFASAAGGAWDVDTTRTGPGFDSVNKAYTVGMTMRASEALVVGVAYGKTKASGSFGQNLGGFHTDEDQGSLFAGLKVGGFYVNGAATIGNIDFRDVHRTIVLGQLTRNATSAPTGNNASAFANAGYDFTFGRFSVGPTASIVSQNVEVNSFSEDGGGSAGLKMFDQRRKSLVSSFGLRAAIDLGNFTPYVKFTADKENKDDPRVVTAMPLSLAAIGSNYDLPAWQPSDSTYTTAVVGFRARVTDYIDFGLTYYQISGRGEVQRDRSYAGTLSLRF